MDITKISNRLVACIVDSHAQSPRYLIRFHHPELYRCCSEQLQREMKEREAHGVCRLLPSALTICCPLRDPGDLDFYRRYLTVEFDRQLRVDAKFYLPAAGKPALSFNPAQRIPWGVSAVGAPRLWRKTKGENIRIGVVDTGADFNHPDIRASLSKGVNLINRLAPAIDDNGHGTHIAGTIAAASTTGGIRGVAPKVVLYPVKAFDHEGSAYVSDIILAIHWCIANRMDIINMSFGMSDYSPALYQAVKAADRRGIIIVASSGNNGKPNAVDFPARLPQTIAVGASTKGGKIAAFSNRGREVDIYAPGEAIYSTWPHNRYQELNGTSMATAHVSGAVALLLAAKPQLRMSRIKSALIDSAIPIGGAPAKRVAGAGRLNVSKAWMLLHRTGKPSPSKKYGASLPKRPLPRRPKGTK